MGGKPTLYLAAETFWAILTKPTRAAAHGLVVHSMSIKMGDLAGHGLKDNPSHFEPGLVLSVRFF